MNDRCDYCNRRQEHYADGKQLCWYHYPLIRGVGRCRSCDIKCAEQLKKEIKNESDLQ